MVKRFILVLCLVLVLQLSATIINIPADQPTIQDGIDVSVNADTVLVQPGTYVENINYIGKNITVASLFLTTQDTSYISQTIIDGNQNGSVVTIENDEDSTAVLTGFTLTNGYSNGGGGILCYNSSPNLSNLLIVDNICSENDANAGGGIYFYNSTSSLLNIIITDNYVSGTTWCNGGGICVVNSTLDLQNVDILNNHITGDSWNHGGGIHCRDSDLDLFDVSLINNSVSDGSWNFGGGIYFENSSSRLYKVIIADNDACDGNWNKGGGIYNDDSYIDLLNVTITHNFVSYGNGSYSGAIHCVGDSIPNLTNCIVWNNSLNNLTGTFIINYSDIEGSWAGIGNIHVDPLFVDQQDGNYHLTQSSPCIDSGDPNSPLDPDGTISDMGAYFYNQLNNIENNELPIQKIFLNNYPNPFNPTTTIEFSIQNNSKVELTIFNIKGQKIKILTQNEFPEGSHSFIWDGNDEYGKMASSGIYYYKLNVNGKTEAVKKCLLLK